MPAKPKTKLSGREAILQVLADGKPKKVKEITSAAAELTDMKGKTPEATLSAQLYTQPKLTDGLFTKVGKGEFKLTAAGKRAAQELVAA